VIIMKSGLIPIAYAALAVSAAAGAYATEAKEMSLPLRRRQKSLLPRQMP
jgi:hypothetical protein